MIRKRMTVEAVQLSNVLIALTIFSYSINSLSSDITGSPHVEHDPTRTEPELSETSYQTHEDDQGTIQTQGCQEFNEGQLRQDANWNSPEGPKDLVQKVMLGFSDQNAGLLKTMTHDRLKITDTDLKKILATMHAILGKPWNVSLLKAWFLKDSASFTSAGALCEQEGVRIFPHYGFTSQWFVWLQVSGPKELGRIFFTVVPDKSSGNRSWSLGFLRFQKWTHAQMDPLMWIAEGDKQLRSGNVIAAGVRYHLGKLLLEGNPHLQINAAHELTSWLNKNLPRDDWLRLVKKSLTPEKVITSKGIYVPSGMGLMVRFQLNEEKTGQDIRTHCQSQLSELNKKIWFKDFLGVRCSYQIKGEPEGKEGRLGSLYLEKEN